MGLAGSGTETTGAASGATAGATAGADDNSGIETAGAIFASSSSTAAFLTTFIVVVPLVCSTSC